MELSTEDLDNPQNLKDQSNNKRATRHLDIGGIVLGSLQPIATFQQVEDTHQGDIAFKYFQFHLNQWLTE